jgi:hypothetical protein
MRSTFYRAGLRKALRRAILMSCWDGLYMAISRQECGYSVQNVGVSPSCLYVLCPAVTAGYSVLFIMTE